MHARAPGWIKICGVTTTADIELVCVSGADAVGINLWSKSPRALSVAAARELIAVVRGRIETVLVVVDEPEEALRKYRAELRPDWLQLHGPMSSALVQRLGAGVYAAVGLATAGDVTRALAAPGDRVLVDAVDAVRRGGTGVSVADELAVAVCGARRTVLAGGLRPENVYERVRRLRPWGVDVASGVERAPGHKDEARVLAFVRAARQAWQELRGVDDV